jgi:hypothetical protein
MGDSALEGSFMVYLASCPSHIPSGAKWALPLMAATTSESTQQLEPSDRYLLDGHLDERRPNPSLDRRPGVRPGPPEARRLLDEGGRDLPEADRPAQDL